MRPWLLKLSPVLIFMLLALFLWRGLFLEPRKLPSSRLGQTMPEFSLPQLFEPEKNFDSGALKGRVALLNVWASWCAACTEEQVMLMEIARQGVPIYGLNYKDNPDEARDWLAHWGNPYQTIGQDLKGRVAIDFGVYGAPETFVVDKSGRIRYRQVGIMTESVWTEVVKPLLDQLEKEKADG